MVSRRRMNGNIPTTVRLVMGPAAIGAAVSATHRFAAAHRLSDDLTARLAVVVEELVTNLIDHGEACGARANLRLRWGEGGVAIHLTDRAKAFDPRDSVASDGVPARGGGAGLLLVMAWTTVRSCRRARGANRLHLFVAGH